MKTKKALHMEMKKGVKNAYRSASSTFKKYFGVTAVVGTLLAAPMLPSLSYAQGKISTVIENLKEMKISDLKKYMENWKKERGDGKLYNGVVEFKDSFGADVSNNGQNIQLKNGKRVLVSSAIYYENFDKETGVGSGISNVFVRVMNGMKSEGSWIVPLAELQDAYREMTDNDLKYVHIVVNHDKNHEKLGEIIGILVIPAGSLEEVKNGDIKPDMPGLTVLYIAEKNTVHSNEDKPNIITVAELDTDVKLIAKK